MKITYGIKYGYYVSFLFMIVTYVLFRHNCVIYLFDVVTILMMLELRYILIRSNYVWKWRENYVLLLLVIVTYFLVPYNYITYFFNVVTIFDDIRKRFYFGTFELHMEITLQLRFVFARHCKVFFITSQLRYLFVRCIYVFWWRQNYVIFWYVRITYGNYAIKWSCFSYLCL